MSKKNVLDIFKIFYFCVLFCYKYANRTFNVWHQHCMYSSTSTGHIITVLSWGECYVPSSFLLRYKSGRGSQRTTKVLSDVDLFRGGRTIHRFLSGGNFNGLAFTLHSWKTTQYRTVRRLNPCRHAIQSVWVVKKGLLQSCFMPKAIQRCNRQYWQRFRCSLLMAHSPDPLQVYTRFFLMLRLKKPLQPSQLTAP